MNVGSSSLSAFRNLVRKQAEDAAQSWVDSLHKTLPSDVQTLEDQLQYWDTLTAMALLDLRGNDERVAAARQEGLQSYKDERRAEQQLPPSAAYLLSHPNGEFVLWTISATDPEPLEVIETHIDIIRKKEAVLRSVNQFFNAVQSSPIEVDDSESPLSRVNVLTALRNTLTSFKSVLLTLNMKLELAKKQPVSNASAWNIMSASTVPEDLNRHISSRQMEARIEAAKDKRSSLEIALADLLSVEHDDSIHAVRKALTAIATVEGVDPTDSFGVWRNARSGEINRLRLTWQDRQVSLSDLAKARSELEAISLEQHTLAEAISTLLEYARPNIGPMLDVAEFWKKVDTISSPNGRVTIMWQELVRVGNAGTLDQILGGKARYLERARRSGFFKEGADNVLVHLSYLLAESAGRWESDAVDPGHGFLQLHQKLKVQSVWSLKDLNELLAEALRPYVADLEKRAVELQPPWPPIDKRLTRSRSAYNLLVEAARHGDHLTIVLMWLLDVQRNVEHWQQKLDELYFKIPRTQPGRPQSDMKRQLRDLCPDFPDFVVEGYDPGMPPLIAK